MLRHTGRRLPVEGLPVLRRAGRRQTTEDPESHRWPAGEPPHGQCGGEQRIGGVVGRSATTPHSQRYQREEQDAGRASRLA